MKPTVGSLFAGIGGFDLAFEREGYEVAWQVEIDDYCQKVLAKHWPHVSRFGDVRDCGLHNLEPVDVICGGFPCADLSSAGNMEGLDGEQSSLWWQMHRIIGELRPRYAVVENVPNLIIRGFDRVIGSLADIGYDAEWHVISAANVGAPHRRKRVWIVANANGVVWPECDIGPQAGFQAPLRHDALRHRISGGWETKPELGRVAHGVPARMDRLRGLGNAIVPQIAQHIARTLLPKMVDTEKNLVAT